MKEWETLVARGYAREARQAVEAEASCRIAGQRARRAIWDPIATMIGQAETVFVVPEGALHLVHFDALPREEGGYLIESRPAIHQLTAEKDLLSCPARRSRREGSAGHGRSRIRSPRRRQTGRRRAPSAGALADRPSGLPGVSDRALRPAAPHRRRGEGDRPALPPCRGDQGRRDVDRGAAGRSGHRGLVPQASRRASGSCTSPPTASSWGSTVGRPSLPAVASAAWCPRPR